MCYSTSPAVCCQMTGGEPLSFKPPPAWETIRLHVWKGTFSPFTCYPKYLRISATQALIFQLVTVMGTWICYNITALQADDYRITVYCYLILCVTTILNTLSLFFWSLCYINFLPFILFLLLQAVTWSWWRTLKGSQQESPAGREESAATSGSTVSSSPPPNRNECSSRPSGTDTRCLATCTRRTGLSMVRIHTQLYVNGTHAALMASLYKSSLTNSSMRKSFYMKLNNLSDYNVHDTFCSPDFGIKLIRNGFWRLVQCNSFSWGLMGWIFRSSSCAQHVAVMLQFEWSLWIY